MIGLETFAASHAAKKSRHPSAGQAGLVSVLSLGFAEKIQQGFVGVLVHSGNYTRAKDFPFIPEWKQDTFYGYYGRGLRFKVPWFQHFELVDTRDKVTHLTQRIGSKSLTDKRGATLQSRVNTVASTMTWGIPSPERGKELIDKGEIDITYESILLRALTKASQGPHSTHTLQEVTESIFKSGMRTVMADYIDPSTAKDADVYNAMSELKSKELFEYGVELRAVYLEETAPSDGQLQKEGLTAFVLRETGIVIEEEPPERPQEASMPPAFRVHDGGDGIGELSA